MSWGDKLLWHIEQGGMRTIRIIMKSFYVIKLERSIWHVSLFFISIFFLFFCVEMNFPQKITPKIPAHIICNRKNCWKENHGQKKSFNKLLPMMTLQFVSIFYYLTIIATEIYFSVFNTQKNKIKIIVKSWIRDKFIKRTFHLQYRWLSINMMQ